jgi:hypothetical protein
LTSPGILPVTLKVNEGFHQDLNATEREDFSAPSFPYMIVRGVSLRALIIHGIEPLQFALLT